VNKQESSLLYRSYLDSKRLEETFFAPPKKQPRPKKKKIILLTIIPILVVLLLFFIFNYEFILIPRSSLETMKENPSLFARGFISSVSFIGQDKKLMRTKGSLVYLTIPQGQRVGAKFDFKKPINLNRNQILFWIKKSDAPLIMEAISRDTRFFSNAREPLKIIIDKKDDSSYNKVPIQFQSSASPNVNFTKINQIKVYFYQLKTNKESNLAKPVVSAGRKNWILIKDIDLKSKVDK